MFTLSLNKLLVKLFKVKFTRARPTFDNARNHLIMSNEIDLVLDGGANRGQWSTEIRREFPSMPVISIEPILAAYQELEIIAYEVGNWSTLNVALGENTGISTMNVANNGEQSSSLLQPDDHLNYYPTVEFVTTQETKVITLDSIDIKNASRIFLKLDLQGNELPALKGATNLLRKVKAIELEMTTVKMYQDQATFLEVASYLADHGFAVFSFADAFRGIDGQSIYVDVLFNRNNDDQ